MNLEVEVEAYHELVAKANVVVASGCTATYTDECLLDEYDNEDTLPSRRGNLSMNHLNIDVQA